MMSQQYDNTNKGTLFKKADRKSTNSPEYTGSIDIEGTEYWLSAWIKVSGPNPKNPGSKFFSLAVTPKEESNRSHSTPNFVDDDIPF